MKKFTFKRDQYKNARGGYSRLLNICCEKCGDQICRYQKDGPGNLRRMYIDRIFEPKVSISGKLMQCSNGHQLGIRIIYTKENRPAFRLFVDAIMKKIVKTG